MVSREETQRKLDLLAAGAMRHTPEQRYTVADRLEERAVESPEARFLIWDEGEISYREANRQANRYAHFALTRGLRRGDVAALMLDNCPDFIYCWMGLAKIGCIAALINTHIKGNALRHALSTTNSKILFVSERCLENLATIDGRDECPVALTIPLSQLDDMADGNPDRTLRQGMTGESTLSLVFTSGTTGLPKAAIVTHMRWLGTGDGWCSLFALDERDVFYCVLPLYHVAAGMSLLSQVLASGGAMVLRPRFSARRFWPDVRQYGVTVTQYSGEMCRYLFNQPARKEDREHSLKLMSGAGLAAELWPRFQQRFGVETIAEGYGGTEINCNLINVDNKVGSCGRIPFKERSNARLVKYDLGGNDYPRNPDGTLIECAAGEVGELLGNIVQIPGVGAGRFSGYTDLEATQQKILHDVFQTGDRWFRTGDLLRRDEDDYYYFVDRIGDTFRWKSENVSTSEVANALGGYAGLELLTVYGVNIPGHEGRAGMAALVMQSGRQFDPDSFYQLATTALPGYAVPVFLRISEQADITSTFKLRKVDLQKAAYKKINDSDLLYVLDTDRETYSPMDNATLARLGIPPGE